MESNSFCKNAPALLPGTIKINFKKSWFFEEISFATDAKNVYIG
jgi:hypothetical protein